MLLEKYVLNTDIAMKLRFCTYQDLQCDEPAVAGEQLSVPSGRAPAWVCCGPHPALASAAVPLPTQTTAQSATGHWKSASLAACMGAAGDAGGPRARSQPADGCCSPDTGKSSLCSEQPRSPHWGGCCSAHTSHPTKRLIGNT